MIAAINSWDFGLLATVLGGMLVGVFLLLLIGRGFARRDTSHHEWRSARHDVGMEEPEQPFKATPVHGGSFRPSV